MGEGIKMTKAKAFKDAISPEIRWKEGSCMMLWPMSVENMAEKGS